MDRRLNVLIDMLENIKVSDTTRDFEKEIYRIINKTAEENYPKLIEKDNYDVFDDSTIPLIARYYLFFMICTIYRKEKNYSKYHYLLEEYKSKFTDFKSIKHLEVMIRLERMNSKTDIKETLSLIKDLLKISPNNPGYLHNYAFCVANAFYDSILNKEENESELNQAIVCIKKAQEKDKNYAKFYATLGRLQIIEEKFTEGRLNIHNAIKLEEKGESYSIRISEYQSYLSISKIYEFMVENKKTYEEFKNEIEDTRKELQSINTNNLEFLGFFTALISFTIGSINIISGQTFEDAARLILTLCGGLLIVFSGFGLLIGNDHKIKSRIIIGLLGIIVVFISLNSIFF